MGLSGNASFLQKWEEFNHFMRDRIEFQPVKLRKWEKPGEIRYLSPDEVTKKKLLHRQLIKSIEPYLESLPLIFIGKPNLVLLTDHEGWVLEISGDDEFLGVCLKKNNNWSITSLGDNGITMALGEGVPVLVYGMDNPGLIEGNCASLGVPIKDKDGSIIGSLGVLTPVEYALPINLAFVLTSAEIITRNFIHARNMHDKLTKMEKFFSMGRVLATTVHDLKNPLANIRAVSQLGMMKASDIKAENYFQRIITNVDSMSEMLTNLMNSYRSEKLVVDDPVPIIEKVVQDIEPLCKVQNIDLEFVVEARLSILLEPGLFRRLLVNLVRNAIQAMPSKGKLLIKVTREGEKALIIIKDTGTGIPVEIQKDIFEPFIHGREDGTGLGLYMVHYAVTEIHGGRIWFETDPNKGTIFFIELPIKGTGKFLI